MYNFLQSKLRIGVAFTRREMWMNPQTEANKMKITSQLSAILNKDDVEVFSTDELPAERRRIMVNGREILSSNNGFLSNYQDAFLVTKYFKEKKIDALFIGFCNYGQEDAIAKLAKELNVPVLLWGPRDSMPDSTAPYRPTDTQCGIFAASKVLRRHGITFTYIENCNINDMLFSEGLKIFLKTARIVKNFKTSRIAQISVRPQQFANLMVN